MKKNLSILFLFFISVSYAQKHTISGYVYDQKTRETVIGAFVVEQSGVGSTHTNSYGFYSLTLKNDSANLTVNVQGYELQSISIISRKDTLVNIYLNPVIIQTEEIKITKIKRNDAEKASASTMSQLKIDPKKLNSLPSFAGEADPLKVLQLMPGVQRGQEGTNGMFIRGGTVDQNLILLDDAPVYNAGHLLGFFSVFNNDALKDVKLVKGGFDAEYGGRLSSVVDIRMDDGNMKQHQVEGSVGLLSSRLTLEGPIKKDTISYMIGVRRSYLDQLSKLLNFPVPYYFYDLNGKINFKVNAKTRIYLSGYFGNDILNIDKTMRDQYRDIAGFGFNLLNSTATLRVNRQHTSKLFANYSLIHTQFGYDVKGDFSGNSILVRSTISDWGLKADYSYYYSNQHTIKFGVFSVQHVFTPNFISTSGEITEFIKSRDPAPIFMMEYASYISDQYKVNENLTLNLGLRLSGALVQTTSYSGFEPRFSSSYGLSKNLFLKASYSRMRQYMHLVSSSTVSLPTDLWYPVTKAVKPLVSDQYAAGFEFALPKLRSKLTMEGYYKKMSNLIEYKEGAQILLNDNFEKELLTGTGEAYGMEFLLQRFVGKWSGWVGYTLSWSTRHFDGLNGGKTYFAKFDRRHDLSFVLNYQPNAKWQFSAVWVYMTGARFTPQIGQYFMPNASLTNVDILPIYTARNAVTMSPTHRLDLSTTRSSDRSKKFKYDLVFGVYNVYNRASPFLVEIARSSNGSLVYQQPGLFGIVPYFAFNFKI
ncbi:MAG: TonB-dependent receptor [Bacteroidetes bacterium]|nr:TonB-dependent receptor [Bacteroidota bacterium]